MTSHEEMRPVLRKQAYRIDKDDEIWTVPKQSKTSKANTEN